MPVCMCVIFMITYGPQSRWSSAAVVLPLLILNVNQASNIWVWHIRREGNSSRLHLNAVMHFCCGLRRLFHQCLCVPIMKLILIHKSSFDCTAITLTDDIPCHFLVWYEQCPYHNVMSSFTKGYIKCLSFCKYSQWMFLFRRKTKCDEQLHR